MSRSRSGKQHLSAAQWVSQQGVSLAGDLKQVILVGLAPTIAAHLLEPIRSVAPNADLQMVRHSDLGSPRSFPDDTLLILQDGSAGEAGLTVLRQLRAQGVATPAILIVTEDDFFCPRDVDELGDLDVIPLTELSRFALRRSLIMLGARASREKLLGEVKGRLRAYERVLAAKDEERLRVLRVATELEHRLSTTETQSRQNESAWATRLARSDARINQLKLGLKGLGDRPREAGASRERERRLAAAQREEAESLAARLEASESVRAGQTQEILRCQRRVAELEQQLTTVAALIETEHEATDPDSLLEQLAVRLMQADSARSEQQGTIDRLSRSLAMKQVDDALDDAQSRRNVVRRVEECLQRARRLGEPLICLMVGLDHPLALAQEHGSVSFDFMLVQVAQRLQLALRHGDVVMRYSDGEFLLISDATSADQARSHASRLVRTVCAQPLAIGGSQVEISLSVGILAYDGETGDAQEILQQTRGCLLEAQAQGERQIQLSVSGALGAAPVSPSELDSSNLTG